MCDFWGNFIIGFLSGGLSSLAVTWLWQKHLDKQQDTILEYQYKTNFSNNIQILSRYIQSLRLELNFEESQEKNKDILRVIESRPYIISFSNCMNDDGRELLSQLRTIEDEIGNIINDNKLDKSKCFLYRGKLLKLDLEFLKKQKKIRVSWNEYKSIDEKTDVAK